MIISFAFAISLSLPAAPSLSHNITQADFPIGGGPAVAFDGAAEVNRIINLPMSPEAQQAFDTEFQAAGYFGAFAMSKDGDYGYTSGAGSILAARDIALAACNNVSGDCMITAEILPQGYVAPVPGSITLSQRAYGYFADAANNPDFKALAMSESGAFSMYWGVGSQSEANAAALADCETNRNNEPGLRDMPCVLVTNLQ